MLFSCPQSLADVMCFTSHWRHCVCVKLESQQMQNSSSDDSSRVGLWFPGLGLGKGAFAFDIGSKQPVWVVIAPVLGFLDSSLCFGSGRLSSWNSAPRLKSFNSSSSEVSGFFFSSLSLFERAPWPGLSTLIGLWYSSVRTRIKLWSPPLSLHQSS